MKNTHMTYGFVTALVIIVVSVVLYVAGLAFKPGMQYITYLPFLIGVILNGVAFSNANNNYVTFGNVFSSCFKACAIITLVILVWSFISLAIFPEMKDKAMEMAREKMAKNPNMTDEQIDMAINMTKKYFTLFMVMGVVFGYMIFGAIFSLIGAAIAKKKGPAAPVAQV